MAQITDEKRHIIKHLRSAELNKDGNGPLLPSGDTIQEGEIAINYRDGYETLAIRNNSGETVAFKSEEFYEGKHQEILQQVEGVNEKVDNLTQRVEDEGLVIAAALTDLNSQIEILVENTPTNETISDIYSQLEGKASKESMEGFQTQLDLIGDDVADIKENYATKAYVDGKLFVGTRDQYDEAYNNGLIAYGALVIILNGDEI